MTVKVTVQVCNHVSSDGYQNTVFVSSKSVMNNSSRHHEMVCQQYTLAHKQICFSEVLINLRVLNGSKIVVLCSYFAVFMFFISCIFTLNFGALNRGLSSFSVGFDNGRASPGRVWLPNSPTHQN